MNYTHRGITALLAATICLCCVVQHSEQIRSRTADSVCHSVTELIGKLPHAIDAETAFSQLCYDAETEKLYRDGTDTGSDCGIFHAENGEILVRAEATLTAEQAASGFTDTAEYLPLKTAAKRLGLAYTETENGTEITAPFQTGTLLVKADEQPPVSAACTSVESLDGLYIMQYATEADAYLAYQAFQTDGSVAYAEPNRILQTAAEDARPVDLDDDELKEKYWGWYTVGAKPFLQHLDERGEPEREIVVAVVDSGVYTGHAWFSGRIADGGISFVNDADGCGRYDDRHGHGTHCAGIIAGMTRENVRILPVKVVDDNGSGTTLQVYCGMIYAAEQHADIVNISLGGPAFSPLLREAAAVLQEAGIPCVAAAGNESADAAGSHPANIESVITVSSVTSKKRSSDGKTEYTRSRFSNYGESVDFAAPGDSILSAGISAPDAQILMSGTSMAAPHVTGCIADLLDYDSSLSAEEIYRLLNINAVDLGTPGFDQDFGWGMVGLSEFSFTERTLPAPEADVPEGRYTEVLHVSLSVTDTDAEIYYTTDGTMPDTAHGIRYEGQPVPIRRTTDLRAAAVQDGKAGKIMHCRYEIICDPPQASVEAGAYEDGISVALTSLQGADIYYTTDGTEPDTGSLRYLGSELPVCETTVLKAVAVIGDTVSETAVYSYVIGGRETERLYRIENGVLLAYYGTESELSLQQVPVTQIGDFAFAGNQGICKITLPDTVTYIGAHAFADCTALQTLNGIGVQEIGAYAFSGCTALVSHPLAEKNSVKSVGDYAFAHSGIQTADCSAAEQIGAYAFTDCKELKKAVLPDELTALPDGIFKQCRRLNSLSASGVTQIGNESLCFDRPVSMSVLDLDFTKVTAVGLRGICGLSFSASGLPDPVFSALETVPAGAFERLIANSLSFPALTEIPEKTFLNCECSLFRFENVQTIAENALFRKSEFSYGVLVGDALTAVGESSFTLKYPPEYLAAPAHSPLHMLARRQGIRFIPTPALYLPEDITDVTVYQYGSLTLRAAMLGFAGEIRWTLADAQYNDGAEAVAVAGVTGTEFVPDTSSAGLFRYSACLYDGSGDLCNQKDFTVHVLDLPLTDTITDMGVYPVEWPETADSAGTYACGFRFTPPRDDSYYIFPNDNVTEYAVIGESVSYDFRHFKLSAAEAFSLKAGEQVTVVLKTDDADFTALTVTEHRPEKTVSAYTAVCQTPVIPESVKVPEYELSIAGQTLTEGEDYISFIREDADGWSGQVYLIGTGAFCGIESLTYEKYEDFGNGAERTVRNCSDVLQFYRILPETTGKRMFYADFPDAFYAQAAEHDRSAESILNSNISLYLYDSEMQELDSQNAAPVCKAMLTAGETYYLAVSADTAIPELTLFERDSDPEPILMYAIADHFDALRFDRKEIGFLKSLRSAGGAVLQKDEDYHIYSFGQIPGDAVTILRGCGAYCGYLRLKTTLLPHNCTEFALQNTAEITFGEAFSQHAATADYQVTLNGSGTVALRPADVCTGRYDAVLYVRDPETWEWVYYASFSDESDTVTAEEGQYRLYLAQYTDETRSFVLEAAEPETSLLCADVEPVCLYFSGLPLHAEFSVTCGGKTLTEQTDFVAEPETDIISCGTYRIRLRGVGKYTGTVYAECTVMPQPASELPVLSVGSNTVIISRAGEVQTFCWTPSCSRACFVKTAVDDVNVTVAETDGTVITTLSGLGYAACEVQTEPGKPYDVFVSYANGLRTGGFDLTVIPDGTMLDTCSPEALARVPAKDTEIPHVQITCGEDVLTEGTDYEVMMYGGWDGYGNASVTFVGKGRYAGTLEYTCERYPEQLPELQAQVLVPGRTIAVSRSVPGDMQLFAMTAEAAGAYRFTYPDQNGYGVSAFLYGPDGSILPQGQDTVYLHENETVHILTVTSRLESDFDPEENYYISAEAVAAETVVFDTAAGCSFRINRQSGSAVLCGVPEKLCGIMLPDTVQIGSETFAFSGISEECEAYIRRNVTLYCEPGGDAAAYCTAYHFCFAEMHPKSGVTGDVTGDGAVNENDLLTLLRILAERESMQLTAEVFAVADCDKDGELTLQDVQMLRVFADAGA